MIYISIYFGIILGHIIRFFRPGHKNRVKTNNHHITLLNIILFLPRVIFLLIKQILFGFQKGILFFISCIKRIICSIRQAYHRGKIKVNQIRQSAAAKYRLWLSKKQSQLLSHDNIYIIAKTAKVYSDSSNIVRLLEYNNVKNHCQKFGDKYIELEATQERPVCIPKFWEITEEKIENHFSPAVYLAILSNITVSGGSSILLTESECLYDPFMEDTEGRLDIKFSNVIGNVNGKIIVEMKPPKRKFAEGIFLMGFASYNYYHFTIEIMSRLKYIDAFEEYRHAPILIDQVMATIPQFREVVEKFNCLHHPIIEVSPDETVKIQKLIYPSYNTWMPINVKKRELIQTKDFLIAKSGLNNIRSYIPFQEKSTGDHIFISRKNLTAARLGNEPDVVELFQKYGFNIVYTEGLTYEQQIELFQNAKCVVGASGAALTNIVYCHPGTDIVCIIPEDYHFYMYSTMAHLLDLHPIFLDAHVTVRTAYTASDIFEVDLNYCERFLKHYLSNN